MHRVKLIVLIIGIIGLAAELVQSHPTAADGPSETKTEGKIRYDGAQLWRIPYDKQNERNVVADLQNTFGEFHTIKLL